MYADLSIPNARNDLMVGLKADEIPPNAISTDPLQRSRSSAYKSVSVRIWTPPRFASKLIEGIRYDCARISGLLSWHTLMPGHNGLFAR